ncbi:type I restriction enzyme S subunit [Xanthomonas sacchari]|uniref:restriction endonuclease subunit S n=1 Tax=Xanthomonas sacchari TaxID=56458 RepID=UPI00277D3F14|nr:restriction endonuclease subunit S [Xanthomonas sacchari]MDQ1094206.1 type I restriction enzyme S subunit [Xanthomonas sacchari]
MKSESWNTESVADCIVPVSVAGKSKIQSRDYKQSGRFPVIDQGQQRIAGWTDDESAVIETPLPLVVFGDHTRAFKFLDAPFARGADGTQLLRPKPGIDPLFFFYACRAIDLPARGYNRHFTVLKEKELSYPGSVDEQKAIAAALCQAESALAQQSALLGTLEELKRAAMTRLFTYGLRGEAQRETEIGLVPESWDVVSFSTVREWLQYGTSVHCTTQQQRYPVLRIPNVEPGQVNANDLKYCNISEAEAGKYLLQSGDLLFIRTNGVLERLGACAVYEGRPQKSLFASYLIRARLKSSVVPRFVAYFYASHIGTSQVAGRATPASDGKYNLNTGTIDSLPLPLPSTLDEQHEIVTILDALDRKIALHRQKRAVLEELFQSLLHKLMTGEIRVADLDLSALPAAPAEAAEVTA